MMLMMMSAGWMDDDDVCMCSLVRKEAGCFFYVDLLLYLLGFFFFLEVRCLFYFFFASPLLVLLGRNVVEDIFVRKWAFFVDEVFADFRFHVEREEEVVRARKISKVPVIEAIAGDVCGIELDLAERRRPFLEFALEGPGRIRFGCAETEGERYGFVLGHL